MLFITFVLGYVLVLATQLVPSARNKVPVPVAVAGNVAVDHVGAAEAPERSI